MIVEKKIVVHDQNDYSFYIFMVYLACTPYIFVKTLDIFFDFQSTVLSVFSFTLSFSAFFVGLYTTLKRMKDLKLPKSYIILYLLPFASTIAHRYLSFTPGLAKTKFKRRYVITSIITLFLSIYGDLIFSIDWFATKSTPQTTENTKEMRI